MSCNEIYTKCNTIHVFHGRSYRGDGVIEYDSVNSELHRAGIGVKTKSAEVLSKECEELCWEKGTLGFSTPTVLQHTVFFYIGLHFVLRGVQEQHDLMMKQFVRVPSDSTLYDSNVYYEYTEYISKTNLHRFTDHKIKNKVVRAYARPDCNHCLVAILDKYIPLLPPETSYMYMRPLQKFPSNSSSPAYARQRVGINQLKKFLSNITTEAGFSGYTNHSLRATAMSRMYNSGVPEKVIADRSGHRSINGLRAYEHPNEELYRRAEDTIVDPSKHFGEASVKKELPPNEEPYLCAEDTIADSSKHLGEASVRKELPPPVKEAMVAQPQFPGFSGLTNCTINLSINTYGK